LKLGKSCNKTHNLKEVVRLEACDISRLLDKALANLESAAKIGATAPPGPVAFVKSLKTSNTVLVKMDEFRGS